MTTLSHHHSALASANFDLTKAVMAWDDWYVYLDDTLSRWEVYLDGPNARAFLSAETWESFDGAAEHAFIVDHLSDDSASKLVVLNTDDGGPFAKAARNMARQTGTDVIKVGDRLTDAGQRATDLAVAAAGMDSASSALQRQVFAVRHAEVAQDLDRLERELAQARSALGLASDVLFGARV